MINYVCFDNMRTDMNPSFSKLSTIFFSQPKNKQQFILKRLHDFSAETKTLLATSLGFQEDPVIFIDRMQKETIGKVYRKGTPKEPNGKIVNQILNNAKKTGVSFDTLLHLEQLAYQGFMEFLHEYGGGPESFDDQACKHLEGYLKLVLQIQDKARKDELLEKLRQYILKKDNMYTNDKDQTFENVTGIPINRRYNYLGL